METLNTDFSPHSSQIEVLDALNNEGIFRKNNFKYITLCAGRGWGKSLMAMFQLIKWGFSAPNIKLMWVTPYSIQNRLIYRQLLEILPGNLVKESNGTDGFIRLANNSIIYFKQAENPDSIRGVHVQYLIIDEAQDISEDAFNSVILPTTQYGKKILIIGTPKVRNGILYYYYNLGLAPNEIYKSFKYTVYDAPKTKEQLDELQLIKLNIPFKAWQSEYLAEFCDTEGSVFINILDNALLDGFSDPLPNNQYFSGIDLGQAKDYSVLSIVDSEYNLVYLDRRRKQDYDTIIDAFSRKIKEYNDAVTLWETNIESYLFEQSKSKIKNLNSFNTNRGSKKEIIEHLAVLMERQKIKYPKLPELIKELSLFEGKYNATTRYVQYSAQGGAHDDCVISLALACWSVLNYKNRKIQHFFI